MTKRTIGFILNNTQVALEAETDALLIDVLRNDLGLTGTKKGCGGGECGACTVLLEDRPVSSCMIFLFQVEGRHVTTVEGIQDLRVFKFLEDSFVSKGAFQCGFCAPGMILSAFALLIKNPNPNLNEIKIAISGNLCRCSGYTKIVEAIDEASKKLVPELIQAL